MARNRRSVFPRSLPLIAADGLLLTVNPGATDALNSAISTADASYNGSLAITVYTNTARSQQAFSTYAVPQIERVMMQFQQKFSAQNAQSVAASANLATILRQAPQVVTMPAGYSMDDVRSFDIPVYVELCSCPS